MSGINKRSIREAQQRQERYQWLFIVKYIEGVHRNVYAEAHEFYNKVKAVNPEVKNLTKTAEFMEKVTPDAVIPRYYTERRRRRNRLVHKDVQTEMALNIQLLPPPEVSTAPQPEVSTSPQPEVSTAPQPEVSTAPQPEVSTSPQPEVSTAPQPEVSTAPQPEVSTSPQPEVSMPLSPKVYEELLNDLRKDSDLWNILNNFPVEDNTEGINKVVVEDMGTDNTEGINKVVVEDMGTDMFLANNITPLEQEVEMVL